VWQVAGRDVTPAKLASLSEARIAELAAAFGRYFATDAPSAEQVKEAIAAMLVRWPVGSLGETA
jgi:hypothetical protein